MSEFLYPIFLVYVLAACSGLGPYLLLNRARTFHLRSLPFVLPLYGLAFASIFVSYVIYFNVELRSTTEVWYGSWLFVLAVAVCLRRRQCARVIRALISSKFAGLSIALALALQLILSASAFRDGQLTTPYRIGIDQVGYMSVANSLFHGETRDSIEEKLKADTQKTNVSDGISAVSTMVNYSVGTTSEFLLGAVRWSFSGVTALMAAASEMSHPIKMAYPILALSLVGLFGLCIQVLRREWGFSWGESALLSLAIVLNCNLLNVLFEGQFGQIFTLPFFALIFFDILNLRRLHRNKADPAHKPFKVLEFAKEHSITLVRIAFFAAAIFPAFHEYVLVCLFIGGVMTIADLVLREFRRALVTVLSGLAVIFGGLILVGPFALLWIENVLFVRFSGAANDAGGWPQPHWATPSEILGFSDMYTHLSYTLVDRSIALPIAELVVILLLLAFWFTKMPRPKSFDWPFWLAPVSFIAFIYVKTDLLSGIHNYQYMKSYTLVMPLIVIGLYVVFSKGVRPLFRSLCLLMPLWMIVVGVQSLVRFSNTSGFFDHSHMQIAEFSDADRTLLEKFAIITVGRLTRREHGLAMLMSFKWLQPSMQLNFKPHLDDPVLVAVPRDQSRCFDKFQALGSAKLLYSSPDLIFIRTERTVRDFISPTLGVVDPEKFAKFWQDCDN